MQDSILPRGGKYPNDKKQQYDRRPNNKKPYNKKKDNISKDKKGKRLYYLLEGTSGDEIYLLVEVDEDNDNKSIKSNS